LKKANLSVGARAKHPIDLNVGGRGDFVESSLKAAHRLAGVAET
jgi:hypothetical protein